MGGGGPKIAELFLSTGIPAIKKVVRIVFKKLIIKIIKNL